jgi:hypothetical protein
MFVSTLYNFPLEGSIVRLQTKRNPVFWGVAIHRPLRLRLWLAHADAHLSRRGIGGVCHPVGRLARATRGPVAKQTPTGRFSP